MFQLKWIEYCSGDLFVKIKFMGNYSNTLYFNLHWLAKGACGVCIVYLDISDDPPSFKETQLPEIHTLDFITVSVTEEGRLCVIANNGNWLSFFTVEVWQVQVYGVHESWTKRYVINNNTITQAVMFKEVFFNNLWSFKNGKIVFMDPGYVVVYDPKHESAIERKLDRFANLISEVNYSESLVSVNSGTYAGKEQIEEVTQDHIRMFYYTAPYMKTMK